MDPRRVGSVSGVAGPLVAGASILLAILLSPTFTWGDSALSDLGVAPRTELLFNGGLVLGGALVLPFAWWLWRDASDHFQRAGAVLFALAGCSLSGVGLFPAGTALHLPAAVGFYALATYALWTHGTGSVQAGDARDGLVTIWIGIVHLSAWIGWALVGVGGLAVPETAGALLIGGWTVAVAVSGRPRDP